MTIVSGPLIGIDGIDQRWLRVDGETITAVETGPVSPRPGEEVIEVSEGFVLPGLVDGHCHGGAGHGFADGADAARRAVAVHRRGGTTTLIASLVSAQPAPLLAAVHELAPLVADGTIDGIHLEGPYLSAARRGAHPASALRRPDLDEMLSLLHASKDTITTVTVAPELPGALQLIRALTQRAVRVGIGHTDSDAADTRAAIDAGASIATHLFNGMAQIHHRAGGPVVALTTDPRVTCELICDGQHLSADVVRWLWPLLARDRVMLVSDASPATGMPDGHYQLGTQSVELHGSAVWTADGGSLAGSCITLLDAVRWCVQIGIGLAEAVQAASDTPARILGLADRGRLAPGYRGDLVITDRDVRPTRVMLAGQWL
jgi:N-acetylglucosamine-6-phosphate deacetylase